MVRFTLLKSGKKDKAQLFTLDVLLALVPLVIMIGVSANAFTGVASQMQDYVFGYSMQRVTDSAVDVLIKTTGVPDNWNANNVIIPGLATTQTVSACVSTSSYVLSNVLELSKLNIINSSYNSSAVRGALYNLTGGYNIRIEVINKSSTNQTKLMDVAAYMSGGAWTSTNNPATISSLVSGAKEVRVSERVIGIVPGGGGGQNITPKWNYSSGAAGNIQGAPAVGDLDGDGEREVVFGSSDDYIRALDKDGNLIWQFNAGNDLWQSSPALADINNDGRLEVIFGTKKTSATDPVFFALNYDGTLLWNISATVLGDEVQASPAIADIDGDGMLDIATSSSNEGRNVFVVNWDGTIKWNYFTQCRFRSSPAIADINNDGFLELVYSADPEKDPPEGNCTDPAIIWAFTRTGGLLWRYDLTVEVNMSGRPHYHSSPAVYDIDGDGIVEVVQSDTKYSLRVLYGNNGTVKWQTPYVGGTECKNGVGVCGESSPALADLNNDGKMEIVVGSNDGRTYAYYSNGTMMWQRATGQIRWSSPAIADVDGDCELEAVIVSNAGTLYVLNGEDGSVQQSKSITTSATDASPIIVDIDGDQLLEIVVGTGDGTLYVFDAPGSGVEWPTFHQCIKRAGYYYDSDCGGSLAFPTLQNPASDAFEAVIRVTIWK